MQGNSHKHFASSDYSSVRYQYIHFSKGFIISIILALLIFFAGFSYPNSLPQDFTLAASLVTFLYGFFTFSYMSFIQIKFLNFKTLFAELNGTVKAYYDTVLATGQKKPIKMVQSHLVEFLTTLKQKSAAEFESSQKALQPLVKATQILKLKKSNDTNNHFNMLLSINKISEIREKLNVFGTRYLLGELRVVYIVFTTLLVIILGSLASLEGIIPLIALFLMYIMIFSMFYIFHLDRMSYSEQVVKNETLDETIKYIKNTNKI